MTEKEYFDRIQALHERGFAERWPGARTEEEEFRLLILYRLGAEFPREKTDALIKIRLRIVVEREEIARLRSEGRIGFLRTQYRVYKMFRRMKREFGSVLSKEEQKKLFG